MGIQEYDFIAQMERLAASLGLLGWLTVVALLTLGVLFVGARISGWHELAKHYASADRYAGRWIAQLDDSGQEGGLEVSLRHSVSDNAIKLGADPRGLYLRMSLPFRPFHPPLFIPWRDIESVGVQELPWVKKKRWSASPLPKPRAFRSTSIGMSPGKFINARTGNGRRRPGIDSLVGSLPPASGVRD